MDYIFPVFIIGLAVCVVIIMVSVTSPHNNYYQCQKRKHSYIMKYYEKECVPEHSFECLDKARQFYCKN